MNPNLANSQLYYDNAWEPQRVETLASNRARMYLDYSTFKVRTDFSTVSSGIFEDPNGKPFILNFTQVRRLALSFVQNNGCIYNVNERNNQIYFKFRSAGTGLYTFHTATLTIGYYSSISILMDALVQALTSAAPPVPGAPTFSYVADTALAATPVTLNNGTTGTIVSSVAADRLWVMDTPFTRKQRWLWNPQLSPDTVTIATSPDPLKCGPIQLTYTRYFDILSNALLEDTKVKPISEDGSVNLIARVYLETGYVFGTRQGFTAPQPSFFNVRRDRQIGTIDYELRDEYNDSLSLPPSLGSSVYHNFPPFYLIIEFIAEI